MYTKKHTFNNTTFGYSLIEMLLVISIITILTSIGIVMYRNHQINNRIEKAALEMQNMVTAAVNYHSDKQAWPLANNDSSTCTTQIPSSPNIENFKTNYIPNQDLGTSFGNYYCWGNLNNDPHIFWIALKVPNNIAFAKRIASLLPNTIATHDINAPQQIECEQQDDQPSDCFVRLEVITTTQGRATMNKLIADIGNCDSKHPSDPARNSPHCQFRQLNQTDGTVDYTVSFHCPAGMLGALTANANFFDIGHTPEHTYPYTLRTMNVSAKKPCPSSDDGNIHCNLHIDAKRANHSSIAQGHGGHVGASYLAYCYSANTTQTKAHALHSNLINNDF